jgi:endonuclease/exonuclease/phosphatase family metal-dependent hydrolase
VSDLRIVSYNILNGGVGRADPIAEVLLAQRPDVVALVEADDPAMLTRIAWRLDMDHVAAVGLDGRTAALLSRRPILASTNVTALRGTPRSFLWAEIESTDGPVEIGVLHLTSGPDREDVRLEESEVVLSVTADAREQGRPHVLCGDFNALSPLQRVELARVPDHLRQGGPMRSDVIEKVMDAGYVDTLAAGGAAIAAGAATFTTSQPGVRFDYIFAHGLTPTAGWVERDRLAVFASDHFPVGAALRRTTRPAST